MIALCFRLAFVMYKLFLKQPVNNYCSMFYNLTSPQFEFLVSLILGSSHRVINAAVLFQIWGFLRYQKFVSIYTTVFRHNFCLRYNCKRISEAFVQSLRLKYRTKLSLKKPSETELTRSRTRQNLNEKKISSVQSLHHSREKASSKSHFIVETCSQGQVWLDLL